MLYSVSIRWSYAIRISFLQFIICNKDIFKLVVNNSYLFSKDSFLASFNNKPLFSILSNSEIDNIIERLMVNNKSAINISSQHFSH